MNSGDLGVAYSFPTLEGLRIFREACVRTEMDPVLLHISGRIDSIADSLSRGWIGDAV